MKLAYFILLHILFFTSYGQTKISQDDFIGSWKFIELQDENGVKHTQIPMTYSEIVLSINFGDKIKPLFFDKF